MFNSQRYNLGKFNVSDSGAPEMIGIAQIKSNTVGNANIKKTAAGRIDLYNTTSGALCKKVVLLPTEMKRMIGIQGAARRICLMEGSCAMKVAANAETINTYGTDYIDLKGLVLHPGDELRINTDTMTIVVNDSNAIAYFAEGSNFFHIEPGENLIVYNDASSKHSAVLTTYWKDRWL